MDQHFILSLYKYSKYGHEIWANMVANLCAFSFNDLLEFVNFVLKLEYNNLYKLSKLALSATLIVSYTLF